MIPFSIEKLSAREKKIGLVTVGLLLAVISYHGIWRPVTAQIDQIEEQIFALQLKIRKANIFLNQKEEILEAAKKIPNLDQLTARKDEEEIASLLNYIEQTARKTGVALSDVKPQQVKFDKISKFYVIELNAESSLKQIVEFAYDLQSSGQMLTIEQTDLAPKEEGSTLLRAFIVVTRAVVLQ